MSSPHSENVYVSFLACLRVEVIGNLLPFLLNLLQYQVHSFPTFLLRSSTFFNFLKKNVFVCLFFVGLLEAVDSLNLIAVFFIKLFYIYLVYGRFARTTISYCTHDVIESLSKNAEIKFKKNHEFSCVEKYFFSIVTINTYLKNTKTLNSHLEIIWFLSKTRSKNLSYLNVVLPVTLKKIQILTNCSKEYSKISSDNIVKAWQIKNH